MSFLHLTSSLVMLVFVLGCYSTPLSSKTQIIDTEYVLATCRLKWDWGNEKKAFGLPTVSLARLDQPLLQSLFSNATIYRITVVDRRFIFGSGPKTKTATCIINNSNITFLETDDEVQQALPPLDLSSVDASTMLKLTEVFAKLCGQEMQIGAPSENKYWAVVAQDGKYPLLKEQSETEPSKWTLVVRRSNDLWIAECTFVSPDHFGCYRYTIQITGTGRIKILNKEAIFPPRTFI